MVRGLSTWTRRSRKTAKRLAIDQSGFTLVESIVAFTILIAIIVAVVGLFGYDLATINVGKTRALGLGLANEKLEYLRDLPYNSLATVYGPIYPPGTLIDDDYQTRGNIKFRVHTDIDYVDDNYDGNAAGTVQGKPVDLYPYDYKRAQVTVYIANSNRKVATLSTFIAAKAAETSSNTGILIIKVVDASGQPVDNATVVIINPNPSPVVNITTTTDSSGLVVIPKLPPDNAHGYHIVASEAGFSTDSTSPDPPGTQTPTNPDPNVLVQQITNITLSIDRTSTLNLHVVDTSGNPVASQSVTITGTKKIYTTPDVYKTTVTKTTDASGNATLSSAEWDSYSFSVPSGRNIVTSVAYSPVALAPNSSQTVTLTLSSSGSWPTIKSATPTTDATGTSSTPLTITGTNLTGASLTLRLSGQSDIVATGVTVTGGGTSLTGNINLATATPGNWDIIITSPAGNQAIQTGGFVVTP